jgi:hypothetical protein
MDFRGLRLVPLGDYPVGALSRRRREAVRRLLAAFQGWALSAGRLVALAHGEGGVEWSAVQHQTTTLAMAGLRMARALQTLEPMELLGLEERAAKLSFYLRLAGGHPDPEVGPQFFSPLPQGRRGFVVEPDLWWYVVDVAGLQEAIHRAFAVLGDLGPELLAAVEGIPIPEVVAREGEIWALDLQARQVGIFALLQAPEGWMVLPPVLVHPRELWFGVRRAWAGRFAPEAVAWRRRLGRCDAEVGCRCLVVADPRAWGHGGEAVVLSPGAVPPVADAGVWVLQGEECWPLGPGIGASSSGQPWRQRLATVLAQVVGHDEVALRFDACTTLEDFVLLALGRCWQGVMARLGHPCRGAVGVKSLNLGPWGQALLYCAPGALFPSAVARDQVRPEDVRSLPLWAVVSGWPTPQEPHPSMGVAGWGVVAAEAVHLCLAWDRHSLWVEAEAGAEWQVRVLWKGPLEGGAPLETVAHFVARQGLEVQLEGEVLQAHAVSAPELQAQRALAILGKAIWGALASESASQWGQTIGG